MSESATAGTTASSWRVHRRRMARKILSEFSHERFLRPVEIAPGEYAVHSGDRRTEYRFRAEVLALDSWNIDETSLYRIRDGARSEVDPVELVVDVGDAIGLRHDAVPEYLEELVNTLALGANRPPARRITADELAAADFQTIEAAMTEGHPCIVANAGRLGFDIDDLERYAPETGARMAPIWVAARRDHCDFAAVSGVDYPSLIRDELDAATVAGFDAILAGRGLAAADYYYLPAHPWQWATKVARIHAVDLAEQRIVPLGPAPDRYQPQQSIRTLFNTSRPARHYVKLALSIVNMGFTRGMSADYMRTTPAINQWVRDRLRGDAYLASVRFTILYEVAAIGYRDTVLTGLTRPGSEYRKLLSALWRESPAAHVLPHEQLTTMAALLHVDHDGDPLVAAFIRRSGIPVRDWLVRYLRCYLHPITYLLYRHELKFSPHGENLILVLDNGVPVRAFLKDIGEEVAFFGDPAEVGESARRALSDAADDIRNLGVLSDVFDDFLRHLAAILHSSGLLADRDFWRLVADSIIEFQREHPELTERFARWDLFAPTFKAIHMNQLQLSDNRHMVNLGDSYAKLVDDGHELANPIAAYRPGAVVR